MPNVIKSYDKLSKSKPKKIDSRLRDCDTKPFVLNGAIAKIIRVEKEQIDLKSIH